DVPVGEAGVDASGVPAAGLPGHAVARRVVPAAHAVLRADARVPEARAALDLVGALQPVVGGRVVVPPGADDAGARHPQGPGAAPVLGVDPDAHLVEEEGGTGAVGDVGESAAVVDGHDGALAQPGEGLVGHPRVAPDVVVGVGGAGAAGVVAPRPAGLGRAPRRVGGGGVLPRVGGAEVPLDLHPPHRPPGEG